MKIKIGDQVRFLNDSGEGKVVRFLTDNNVDVRTRDGWDIPYPLNELLVVPGEDGGDAYKPEPFEKEPVKKPTKQGGLAKKDLKMDSPEVFLLIIQDRENEQFSGVQIFLVNDSDLDLDFIYYRLEVEKCKLEQKDTLEPGTKIILDQLGLQELSALKGWQIQGILSNPDMESISPVINKNIPFQTKKFASAGAYVENDFLHDPAMVLSMIPDDDEVLNQSLSAVDLNHILDQKEKGNIELNKPKVFQSTKTERPPKEIDLHVNKLIDSVIGLSNREIINIQMEAFHKELNQAITSNARSIIFIHGIGNGTLKKELYKSIERDYLVCEFEDAPYKEYGFGATLVRIRQNK